MRKVIVRSAGFSVLLLVLASMATGCGNAHPIFGTPVTGRSAARPAIKVDILDETESWFTNAELYLAVQSSRFPANTWILMPINVGDFAGAKTRFVQLPFEVQPDDKLLFNLLDEDGLTHEQVEALVAGSRVLGYCILAAGQAYEPDLALLNPSVEQAPELLRSLLTDKVTLQAFDNYGTAEFIVGATLPQNPQESNKVTIINDALHATVTLQIYGPEEALD